MKRLTSPLLSLTLALNTLLFFSCQAEEKAEPKKRENLSHYKRSTVSLPYGESMTDIPPYYDPNSTELTVITSVRNEIFDIDEETEEAVFVRYDYDYFAVKLNYELDTVSHIELETGGSALITSYLTDSFTPSFWIPSRPRSTAIHLPTERELPASPSIISRRRCFAPLQLMRTGTFT